MLLRSGADASIANMDGDTPADIASRNGHHEIVALLEKHSTRRRRTSTPSSARRPRPAPTTVPRVEQASAATARPRWPPRPCRLRARRRRPRRRRRRPRVACRRISFQLIFMYEDTRRKMQLAAPGARLSNSEVYKAETAGSVFASHGARRVIRRPTDDCRRWIRELITPNLYRRAQNSVAVGIEACLLCFGSPTYFR